MAIGFYVDEDLSTALAGALRSVGYRADDTREVGNAGLSDPDQLAFATRRGLVILTANFNDFRMLHRAWLVWAGEPSAPGSPPHAGILVLPNPNDCPLPAMVQVIDAFAKGLEPADLRNRLLRYKPTTGWRDFSTPGQPVPYERSR